MKKILRLFLLLSAFIPMQLLARDFEYAYQGVTVTYTVIDEDAKTVMTKDSNYYSICIDVNTTGDVVLPQNPMDGDTMYTLTEIGTYSFCNSKISSVSLPSTVTTINQHAFYGCKNLYTIDLPEALTTLGEYAFSDSGLKYIEIPEKVTELTNSTFAACQNLESIKLPSHLTKIGQRALWFCGLKSLEIPEGVTIIDSDALSGCVYMESLTLPSTLKTLSSDPWDPFAYLFSLQSLTVKASTPPVITKEGVQIGYRIHFPVESCTLYVPAGSESKYEGSSYWNCLEYITAIGNPAPITLATIDGLKYSLKHSDQTATLVPNGRTVRYGEEYTFPNPNESYVSGSLDIPERVEYDGKVYDVTALAQYVFYQCSTIEHVSIPESITSIPRSAFSESGLVSVSMPDNLREIGVDAFSYCNNLISISFPPVETIGLAAFSSCSNLENITFSEGTTEIGGFSDLPKLTNMRLPSTLKTLGSCTIDLSELVLPASIEQIDGLTFRSDCKVYSLNPVPPALTSFSSYGKRVYLYVPEASVTAYKNAKSWKSFYSIEPIVNGLSVEASAGGSIAVNGILMPDQQCSFDGEDFTFKFFPDENYVVNAVSLNGNDVYGDISNRELNLSGLMMQNHLEVSFAERQEATLCVKGTDSHSTIHTYPEGTEANIELRPEAGWTVHTVLYNDEDVTAEFTDNVFTTAPLYGDNSLVIVLSHDTTAEIDVIDTASLVSLSVTGNTVTISGLGETDLVTVNDLSGMVVYSGLDREIPLLAGNVYIIATPRKVFKVTL